MAERQIVRWVNGQPERWLPTTLDRLGKDEKFLEGVLAACPELMGLASRRSGIRGPFKIFTQLSLQTPSGRAITLDIVALSSSGHIIVVEVKRNCNPELRDRAVIAQIIDYASSFASLTEAQACSLFASVNQSSPTWGEIVQSHFPDDDSCDELAEWLLKRMQNGELNLVIACDKIPPGLPEVVKGIAAQNAFGFDLDLIEVAPYVRENSATAEIIFSPSTRLATEIVARTAVTVTYRQGESTPSAEVQITSMEEVEENVREAKRGENPNMRNWTPEEVAREFRLAGNQTALELLEFAKNYSIAGKYLAEGRKLLPSFGFYVKGVREDGLPSNPLMLFNCTAGRDSVYIFNRGASFSPVTDFIEFKRRLKSLFGAELDIGRDDAEIRKSELTLRLVAVASRLREFKEVCLWYQKRLEAHQRASE